ncbi:hypothetical protein NM688_g4486 [Phlebia brevispora]|uniref:Uncharacterized protein n=1 Tax=Phlebia brevispora TaxID=194682 RepID=A0ACC1T2H3_9APHY|nr:hypothetical protein NM688_g4486 [Phlebia brevispora]
MSISKTFSAKLVLLNPLLRREDATLPSSLSVNVSFEGQLPAGLSQTDMPLEVSITLPYEFVNYIMPVIKAASIPMQEEDDPGERRGDVQYITFLPLRTDFDRHEASHWLHVGENIREWLLDVVVETHCPEWAWGSDLYWIALFAAHPNIERFPWALWDPKIAMVDTFGDRWMQDKSNRAEHNEHCTVQTACSVCRRAQDCLWEEFSRLAGLFFRVPIITAAAAAAADDV